MIIYRLATKLHDDIRPVLVISGHKLLHVCMIQRANSLLAIIYANGTPDVVKDNLGWTLLEIVS